jgi:hypothetical protein
MKNMVKDILSIEVRFFEDDRVTLLKRTQLSEVPEKGETLIEDGFEFNVKNVWINEEIGSTHVELTIKQFQDLKEFFNFIHTLESKEWDSTE